MGADVKPDGGCEGSAGVAAVIKGRIRWRKIKFLLWEWEAHFVRIPYYAGQSSEVHECGRAFTARLARRQARQAWNELKMSEESGTRWQEEKMK